MDIYQKSEHPKSRQKWNISEREEAQVGVINNNTISSLQKKNEASSHCKTGVRGVDKALFVLLIINGVFQPAKCLSRLHKTSR